jgi:hypothetical protein
MRNDEGMPRSDGPYFFEYYVKVSSEKKKCRLVGLLRCPNKPPGTSKDFIKEFLRGFSDLAGKFDEYL